jgi:O-antigen/teichoic acid export membrane protein
MTLRRNIAANLASQIYASLIGIVLVPLYLRYMGAEAYGLVGFFAMLQAWFSLLDVGLTPTVARETARWRGGAIDALSLRRLVRSLELLFLAVALAGVALMWGASHAIAGEWLRAQVLPPHEVLASVQLMAPAIALRWMAGLYRATLTGLERLVWLGAFNALVATLRFAGVLPLLLWVGATPTLFFGYQLAVALLELAVLVWRTYADLPALPAGARAGGQIATLRPVLKFSLSIAFTSSVWVLVTQTDKLVLSRVLPLDEYGYYSLAVLVASGIITLTAPIGNALMPRMAVLEASGEHAQLIRLYRRTTQLVAVLATAAALTLAYGAEPLLLGWTGNAELARRAAPVLALYALGNGMLAVAAFPFYLQFAKGDLRLHLIGNAAFVVLLIPAIVWSAVHYGGIGAGVVWLGMNVLSFVAWLPLVHRKFEPGLNRRWYLQDIAVIAAAGAGIGYAIDLGAPAASSTRPAQLAYVALLAASTAAAAALASSVLREYLRTRWRMPAAMRPS